MARNHRVGRGEIDLIAVDGRQQVAVEVKTRKGAGDPTDAFTDDKERQVRGLASQLGIARVDLVAVSVDVERVEIRWLPRF